MGWFSSPAASVKSVASEDQVEALRGEVQDLLVEDYLLSSFVTERTLRRYLAARSFSVERAAKALRKTLAWRKEFRPELITWDQLDPGRTRGGRLEILAEQDVQGRPVLLYRVRQPTMTATGEEYLRFWFYVLESAARLGDELDKKALLVFDMEGYSNSATVLPPFWTRLEAINLAQAHYPEQLGHAVVGNPPMLFWALWKAIKPLLDPVTKAKVSFANTEADVKVALDPLLPPEVRYPSLGGTKPEPPNYEEMSQLFRGIDKRRAAHMEKVKGEMEQAALKAQNGMHTENGNHAHM